MSIESNKAVVLRFNREFLEGGNEEVLKELIAPGFTNHTAMGGVPKDVTGLTQFIGMLRKGFPDLTVEIQEMIGEGDLVSTMKRFHATHTGEIMGKAPTGKKVIINVMDLVRVVNGQYLDHWGRNDTMAVIQAL